MFKFKTGLIVAAAAVGLMASGFAANAQQKEVVIGAAGNTGGLAIFVAQDKGFFSKNGIDVKVEIRNTGSELSKGLRSGEFDYAPAAFTNLPVALERGFDVRGFVGYVGAAFEKTTADEVVALIASEASGINSMADLKGKKVGVTFGSTGDLWLRQAMKEAGLGTNDLERINTRPPSLVSVLDTGGVDAIVGWEPFNFRATEKVKGSKIIKRGGDLVCFCAYLHGNPERVYGDEETTQKLVDAISEAAAFVRNPANRNEVAEIGARFANATKEEVMAGLDFWVFDPRIGANTAQAFRNSVDLLIEQKKMKAPYDPARYLDSKFVRSTMQRHPEWFADLGKGS
jgi:ABC-type nitrate/sulfonate/bicarbonate transport system substrate-binding protein